MPAPRWISQPPTTRNPTKKRTRRTAKETARSEPSTNLSRVTAHWSMGSELSRNKTRNPLDTYGRTFLCPNGATSSSPGLARLGPTLATRGDNQLPQRGCDKLLPRSCRPAVALGNHAPDLSGWFAAVLALGLF